jgi:AcrR family transcriptional regulator
VELTAQFIAVSAEGSALPTCWSVCCGMPRVSEAERPRRQRRLVEAAWRCLERGSFAELRVEDVCQEAGLSKGSFYGYFAGKRDLLYALVDDDFAVLIAAAAEGSQMHSGPAGLRHFAEAVLRGAEDRARMQLRADIWAAAVQDQELERRLRDGIARRRAILRGWIEQAFDGETMAELPSNALASVLLALADGLTLHYRVDPDAFRWEKVRLAVEAMLSGLEA